MMLYGAVELKLIRDDTYSTVSGLKVMVPDSNKPNKPVFLYKHVINTNRWTDGTEFLFQYDKYFELIGNQFGLLHSLQVR